MARLATDAVSPYDLVAALEASEQKTRLAVASMVVRGALSGALLAAATLLAVTAWAQGVLRIVGAMIFFQWGSASWCCWSWSSRPATLLSFRRVGMWGV